MYLRGLTAHVSTHAHSNLTYKMHGIDKEITVYRVMVFHAIITVVKRNEPLIHELNEFIREDTSETHRMTSWVDMSPAFLDPHADLMLQVAQRGLPGPLLLRRPHSFPVSPRSLSLQATVNF